MRYRYDDDISESIVMQRQLYARSLQRRVCGSKRRGSSSVMNAENRDVKTAPGVDRDNQPATGGTGSSARLRFWANWVLAALTVLGAGVVMIFALGSVMSTAACSDKQCPNLGPHGISFDALFYGAPVVAALTVVVSFFTARRRWGVVVPIVALALLGADIGVLAATVAQ